MILVLGATGATGREVARQLIAIGERPRLFLRNPTKATEFVDRAEILKGELGDESALDSALDGIEGLYLVASGLEGFDHEIRVVDAAKKHGVRHIVKLSAIGADQPLLTFSNWHARVEQHLMASDLRWTMLRPGSFMSNALLFWAETIRTQNTFYQPTGDGRWAAIDPADIASVAVKALTSAGHEGKGYTLTGAESMNGAEYADALSTVLGRRITFIDVPPDAARTGMLQTGMPPEYVDAVMDLMAAMKSGAADYVTDTFEQLMERRPITFAEWVRKNNAAFQ